MTILAAAVSHGRHERPAFRPAWDLRSHRFLELYFYDDLESGASWWTHGNLTASVVARFHLSAYCAYDGSLFDEDRSWWCGTLDYDDDGGYGNGYYRSRAPLAGNPFGCFSDRGTTRKRRPGGPGTPVPS